MQLSEVKRAHFIAIGGAGMSGIAWVMLHRGIEVTGSDLVGNGMTRRLIEGGARCFIGHSPDHLNASDLVVVSTAIGDENCELREAQRRGLPIWHRSQALNALMSEGRSVGVAGSHGKTTTTCMVGLIFERAGCDPTIVVGGESANFGGTARAGRPDWVVAELDESDGSFLDLRPDHAMITNVEADHLDHYGNYEAIVDAFEQFAGQVKNPPVVCTDDAGVRRIIEAVGRPFVGYSLSDRNTEYGATGLTLSANGSRFVALRRGRPLGEVTLTIPGVHNIYNALGAIAVSVQAGLDPATCCQALAEFCGVGRRLTVRAEAKGVLIVDDYAHHPTEISATLKVGRVWANERQGRLFAVFQPHRYTRTKALGREFGPAFSAADDVVITGIYAAGERPIEGVTGEVIADSVKAAGHPKVRYLADPAQIASMLETELASGDVVITLGAGNVWQVGDALRKCLEQKAA